MHKKTSFPNTEYFYLTTNMPHFTIYFKLNVMTLIYILIVSLYNNLILPYLLAKIE